MTYQSDCLFVAGKRWDNQQKKKSLERKAWEEGGRDQGLPEPPRRSYRAWEKYDSEPEKKLIKRMDNRMSSEFDAYDVLAPAQRTHDLQTRLFLAYMRTRARAYDKVRRNTNYPMKAMVALRDKQLYPSIRNDRVCRFRLDPYIGAFVDLNGDLEEPDNQARMESTVEDAEFNNSSTEVRHSRFRRFVTIRSCQARGVNLRLANSNEVMQALDMQKREVKRREMEAAGSAAGGDDGDDGEQEGDEPLPRRGKTMSAWNVFYAEETGGKDQRLLEGRDLSAEYRALSHAALHRLVALAIQAQAAKEAGNPRPLRSLLRVGVSAPSASSGAARSRVMAGPSLDLARMGVPLKNIKAVKQQLRAERANELEEERAIETNLQLYNADEGSQCLPDLQEEVPEWVFQDTSCQLSYTGLRIFNAAWDSRPSAANVLKIAAKTRSHLALVHKYVQTAWRYMQSTIQHEPIPQVTALRSDKKTKTTDPPCFAWNAHMCNAHGANAVRIRDRFMALTKEHFPKGENTAAGWLRGGRGVETEMVAGRLRGKKRGGCGMESDKAL